MGIGFSKVFHVLYVCLSMSKYPLGSNLGGTGDWGGDWVSKIFHMLNLCLSMSKYPLGSNLGGTGDWGGDWGFRVGIGFRLSGLRSFTCETYVFLCQSILYRV